MSITRTSNSLAKRARLAGSATETVRRPRRANRAPVALAPVMSSPITSTDATGAHLPPRRDLAVTLQAGLPGESADHLQLADADALLGRAPGEIDADEAGVDRVPQRPVG